MKFHHIIMAQVFRCLPLITICFIYSAAGGQCPTEDSISPCICTDTSFYGLYLQCANVQSEQELRSIFHNSSWIDTDFGIIMIQHFGGESLGRNLFGPLTTDTLEISYNTNLRTLEDGLLEGPIGSRVRIIDISKNPSYDVIDLHFMAGAKRTDIIMKINECGANTITTLNKEIPIQSLSLNTNELKFLSDGSFKNIKGLKYLYVSANNISYIEPGTFENLEDLADLQIAHNSLGPTLAEGSFVLPSSLGSLLLDYNNLEGLEPGAITGFAGSSYLSLWSNNIVSFEEHVWRPILEPLANGGGRVSLYYNRNLPCNDCSIVWLFLNPDLLKAVDMYYCDDFTTIQDIDPSDLIESCTL